MKTFNAQELAKIALEIGAVKINADQPFQWASGYKMPVYNDNRLLLGNPDHRRQIGEGLRNVIIEKNIQADVVAGTATAGIPHATTLANILNVPLVYVRSSAKTHGLENQIEGVLKKNQKTVVIEDVISTGGSVLKAVEALRSAGAIVEHCICIFNYGFDKAVADFAKANCGMHSLLTFQTLLDYASDTGAIPSEHVKILTDWYSNPFQWGENQGSRS